MPRLQPVSSCNLPQNGIAVRLSDCRSTHGLAPGKFCRRVKPLVKIRSLFNRCSRQPGQIAGRHISDAFIRPTIAVAEMAVGHPQPFCLVIHQRSEEHTSELQSLMRISYAVFCLKIKKSKPPYLNAEQFKHYT